MTVNLTNIYWLTDTFSTLHIGQVNPSVQADFGKLCSCYLLKLMKTCSPNTIQKLKQFCEIWLKKIFCHQMKGYYKCEVKKIKSSQFETLYIRPLYYSIWLPARHLYCMNNILSTYNWEQWKKLNIRLNFMSVSLGKGWFGLWYWTSILLDGFDYKKDVI